MKIKVFYLGYDIKTVYLINSSERFELIGVAAIPELIETKTYNLFDSIFKSLYKWQLKNRYSYFQQLLIFLLHLFKRCASNLYTQYTDYLLYLIKNKISIIDENAISTPWDIDIFIVNNWWKISSQVLEIPRYGCINIHPSNLPKYRGSVPTLWSLKNGDNFSAVSFIILNSKIDTGLIIAQHIFPIELQDDSIDIEHKIENIISIYLLDDIDKYISGVIIPYEQSEEEASLTAKYYDYMQINFNTESNNEIRNKVILYPYLFPLDLCYFIAHQKKIHVKSCLISSKEIEPRKQKRIGLNLYIGCRDSHSIKIRLFKDLSIRKSLYIILAKYD